MLRPGLVLLPRKPRQTPEAALRAALQEPDSLMGCGGSKAAVAPAGNAQRVHSAHRPRPPPQQSARTPGRQQPANGQQLKYAGGIPNGQANSVS